MSNEKRHAVFTSRGGTCIQDTVWMTLKEAREHLKFEQKNRPLSSQSYVILKKVQA